MFPTSGFFRGIICPENEAGDSGRCKRPYCHFHHVRRVPNTETAVHAKKVQEGTSQKSASRSNVESSSLPSYRKHKDRTPASKPILYVPTPLSLCKKPPGADNDGQLQDASMPDSTEEDMAPDQSAMYTPTPLSELDANSSDEGNLQILETSGEVGIGESSFQADEGSSHHDVASSSHNATKPCAKSIQHSSNQEQTEEQQGHLSAIGHIKHQVVQQYAPGRVEKRVRNEQLVVSSTKAEQSHNDPDFGDDMLGSLLKSQHELHAPKEENLMIGKNKNQRQGEQHESRDLQSSHAEQSELHDSRTVQDHSDMSLTSMHQPSVDDVQDMDDDIIETHTYGGITVTTRTPRSMCKSAMEQEAEDEYNPFESDFGQTKLSTSLEKDTSKIPKDVSIYPKASSEESLDDSGYSQPNPISEDIQSFSIYDDMIGDSQNMDMDAQFSEDEDQSVAKISDAFLGEDPLYGMEDVDFKGYSANASYSYSEREKQDCNSNDKSSSPDKNKHNFTKTNEKPSYSTSEDAKSKECVSKEKVKTQVKDSIKTSQSKLKSSDVKKDNIKFTNKKNVKMDGKKNKSDGKGEEVKMKTIIVKKIVRIVKKVPVNVTDKQGASVKKVVKKGSGPDSLHSKKTSKVISALQSSEKKKAEQTKEKKIVHKETKPSSSKSPEKRKIKEEHKEVTNNNRTSVKKEMSEKEISDSIVTEENKKPADITKRKVSSEQLSDFFKKRQELKASKEGKVISKSVKSDTNKNSSTNHETLLKQPSKEDHPKHKTYSKHTESVASLKPIKVEPGIKHEKMDNNAKGREGSLFDSVKKKPSKVVAKKPSVKECDFDLFAIANDSSSSESEDGDKSVKKEQKDKQKNNCEENRTTQVFKTLKHSDKQESNKSPGQGKRPGSPSRQTDPKRSRKMSSTSSFSRQESSKMVELDLFGDDSDNGSDDVMLLDSDIEKKSPKKERKPFTSSDTHSRNKDKPVITYPSKKAKSNMHSGSDKSKYSSSSSATSKQSPSKTALSKTVSSEKENKAKSSTTSNFISSKSVMPKKHSNVGKPKLVPVSKEKSPKRSTDNNSSISAHKLKISKRDSDSKKWDISSSDDDNFDDVFGKSSSDDLPSGLHSVSYKQQKRKRDGIEHTYKNDDDGNHQSLMGKSKKKQKTKQQIYDIDVDEEDDYGSDHHSAARAGSSGNIEDMKQFLEESSEEEDTFDECYRIFQEDSLVEKPSTSHRQRNPEKETEEMETSLSSVGKQRVAHTSKFGKQRQSSASKKPPKKTQLSASQMCQNRYLMLQKRIERGSQSKKNEDEEEKDKNIYETAGSSTTGKQRIAHTGSNSTLKELTLGPSPSSSTIAMTSSTGKRVAHMPKTVTKRPLIPTDYATKFPMNIRQRYLNVFIDELLKTAVSEQEAFDKALEEEKIVHQRASTKNIYLNLCVNALKKLQNSTAAILKSPTKMPTVGSNRVISHEAVLGGKLATKTTYSIHKPVHAADVESFDGAFLYEKFKPFILSEGQLRENGFPRPSDIPGQAVIYKEEQNKTVSSSDPNLQVCSRCGATFLRKPDGEYITMESCTYHWGKPWNRRIAGAIESRFSCCSGDMETKGCCVGRLHVTDNKSSSMTGFMKTMSKPASKAGHPGMYAMDCEMCYTNMGLELTRVTVIDDTLKEVYDTLVKPDNEVIDCNTRFSGISEEDLRDVKTRLRDVQAVLLNMFADDTILMGHSLESDLLALKLMHNTVIDTSVVFPHRRGPPFKRALRTLMAEFLKRLIQDDVGGHDSAEDARSCMELMIWKVKEDAKVKIRRR